MSWQQCLYLVTVLVIGFFCIQIYAAEEKHARRILVDTDVDTDDIFGLLYLLKQNKSEFDLQGITINSNGWSNAGHAVNHIYDILYMMGRDDISVGVGGEGGILDDGTIQPDVGGYLPMIDQGISTSGECRYRQTIPVSQGGRLDVDSNYGIRKAFLPRGKRGYSPWKQATVQQVMIDKIAQGPITVIILGSHTNLALFLMSNPHLKKYIEHIYVMGGGELHKNSSTVGGGNLFTDFTSNPYAEYNIFEDPFAAYQVIHSGIPVTLVPLSATNTIPTNEEFFKAFEHNQNTYEAQYCFRSLKMIRDVWPDSNFYTSYFMWDSFAVGIALSVMQQSSHYHQGQNEFAEMEYMNITVVTSNEPYGASDDSNPFFRGREVPKFGLEKDGIHSGHVQTGLRDPFCIDSETQKGVCKDGYVKEVSGPEGVQVVVATKAKPSKDAENKLNRQFFESFLKVLNDPHQTGRFNFTKQFPYYGEIFYHPVFESKKLGRPVVFDMDMSAGDFISLIYLLKLPMEVINLKAILVSPTGWGNAATIDVIYDLLHMMGRDDIPVGLGDLFAMNQSDHFFPSVGGCKYSKAIPYGSGGFLDSDTLFGLARTLPCSPRRYTVENLVEFGAPRDTDNPELRQPLALEVWDSVIRSLDSTSKITILTNGPLTNLAKIALLRHDTVSLIEEVYIVGGYMTDSEYIETGNLFTVPSNKYAEFNMFLDPLAAKTVFESELDLTLIPVNIQRKVSSFRGILNRLHQKMKTPEAIFAERLMSRLERLRLKHHRYKHMDIFIGEILGAVVVGEEKSGLNITSQRKRVKVIATGSEFEDGTIVVDEKNGKLVRILKDVDLNAYYDILAYVLNNKNQSARMSSKPAPKL